MPTTKSRGRKLAGGRRGNPPETGDIANGSEGLPSAPELIVVAGRGVGLRATRGRGITSTTDEDISSLVSILSDDATLEPLFGVSEDRLIAEATNMMSEAGAPAPDLSVFYRVEAPPERLEELAAALREQPLIEAAYVKPPAEPPRINDMVASEADAPPVSPNFTGSQLYLGAAPGGIDADHAHTRPGGKGAGVRIIDIEGAWRFSHEDLLQNQGGVVGGVQNSDIGWRNHGTAVVGVFGGDDNTFGIRGICPDANVRAFSIFLNAAGTSANSAQAIRNAANMLNPGDIMLIELHRPGPRNNFQTRADQLGYIAVEWWQDDFAAIQFAVGRGVIVVEAAGNGAENLDDPLYNLRPAVFPAGWTNPFNRANRDSGAILVGAGAPPPGTHGRDHGPDRSRLGFSNFGASIDAQGWGREVTSTGYGNLQGGGNEDIWYTDTFSGTSSASPIIVGALGCVQGNRRARGLTPHTPAQARQLLRTTGSPQQDAPGRPATQRIGNRPNLRQLIASKQLIKEVKLEKIEHKDKLEKLEIKEAKREKIEKLEQKEKNEKLELKEAKREKLEKIEIKEKREKLEVIEKQFDKKFEKQFEKQQEKGNEGGGFGGDFGGSSLDPYDELGEGDYTGGGESIEARLARLEAAVGLGGASDASLGEENPALLALPPLVCTLFGTMPVGAGPNPRPGSGGTLFLVRGFTGAPMPFTRIRVQASALGVLRGLDCGFSTDVRLSVPAQQVTLSLAHFSQPATVQVFGASGPGAIATMTPVQGVIQTLTLNGTNIRRVVIRAPRNETLLVRFCSRTQVVKKLEIKEVKEKNEVKELKEHSKDGKEVKEHGKEHPKEGKDIKEPHKENVKEIKDAEHHPGGFMSGGGSGFTDDSFSGYDPGYAHFIGSDLRPDLGEGALTGEADLDAGGEMLNLSQQLAKDAADAKQAKDNKDVEKPSEQ